MHLVILSAGIENEGQWPWPSRSFGHFNSEFLETAFNVALVYWSWPAKVCYTSRTRSCLRNQFAYFGGLKMFMTATLLQLVAMELGCHNDNLRYRQCIPLRKSNRNVFFFETIYSSLIFLFVLIFICDKTGWSIFIMIAFVGFRSLVTH